MLINPHLKKTAMLRSLLPRAWPRTQRKHECLTVQYYRSDIIQFVHYSYNQSYLPTNAHKLYIRSKNCVKAPPSGSLTHQGAEAPIHQFGKYIAKHQDIWQVGFHPFYRPRRPLGCVEAQLYSFLGRSALRWGWGGQPHTPAASTPGKDPVPIVQEAGWASGPVWAGGKSRPPPGFDPGPSNLQSVAIPTELPGP